MDSIQLIDLSAASIQGYGCYCLRSMQKSPGYMEKVNWTKERFSDGLKYILAQKDKKSVGFIEYAPEECSWRVVHAENYIVIQCLWVGLTGHGLGSELIHKCIEDARKQNKYGVVVVTNADTSWAPSKEIFIKNNFKVADQGPYSFELYAYKLCDAPDPYFPQNWAERLQRFDKGLTILRTQQCPYLHVATENVIEGASVSGIKPEIIELTDRETMMALSPTPYGVFNVICNGELISYHRLTPRSVAKKIKQLMIK